MLVNFIFRKRGPSHNSIEELFASIIKNLPSDVAVNIVELPHGGASLKAVFLNIWHVLSLKGIIHITGDVHYIGIIPFKKTILTIHDVNSIIKGTSIRKFMFKTLWFTLPGLFVKKITVISKFSKHEVLQVIPWAKNKTEVIYNPVNPLIETKPKDFNAKQPTILHIGTKANKNLENTIKSLQHIPCKLVIVGPLSKNDKDILELYKIDFLNYTNIAYKDIVALYQDCDLVSFVSLYEGFGMPIIEAQKTGRVVVTSQRASIPEIAGDSVCYADPLNVEDMQKAFKTIIENNDRRNKLIDLGFNNVEQFEVKKIASKYFNLYKKI
ncbi:Glycosyltransferase involved in cell wall bisynthesis [Algibacter lectus]|uniref:glycosyltransferase family 4 protein n=1 Tax=Algibacter lectus TaxID=221126 RepID=UPI0008E32B1C|nr:glycosyltransferase family 1 protein [Algibacter lectus]SFD29892.1 Glycosyltransferase involved in cell wall bisynthesis [Algibacter lectus]